MFKYSKKHSKRIDNVTRSVILDKYPICSRGKYELESFALIVNCNMATEAVLLIKSIRNHHDQPIYVLCDAESEHLIDELLLPDIHIYTTVNDISNDVELELVDNVREYNEFHDSKIIFKKMEIMEIAMSFHNTTFFLDADIILLKALPENYDHELVLSPHYHADPSLDVMYGAFNAGYLFCANPTFPSVWRDIYLHDSIFYEQEGLNRISDTFKIGIFSSEHNIGIWRNITLDELYDIKPISIHCHTEDILGDICILFNKKHIKLIYNLLRYIFITCDISNYELIHPHIEYLNLHFEEYCKVLNWYEDGIKESHDDKLIIIVNSENADGMVHKIISQHVDERAYVYVLDGYSINTELYRNCYFAYVDDNDMDLLVNNLMRLYGVTSHQIIFTGGTQHVSSFCTVIMGHAKYEGSIMIESLRKFHNEPIFVICDEECKKYLKCCGFSNIRYRIMEDPHFDDIEKKTDFHSVDAIGMKMESMDFALEVMENTMFVDSDIVFLERVVIESRAEVVLTNHLFEKDKFNLEKYSGSFNAGYIFTSNKDFPAYWRYIYHNKSKFYEQEGLYNIASRFSCDVFSDRHNIGYWRGEDFVVRNPVSFHVHVDDNIVFYDADWKRMNDLYKHNLLKILRSKGFSDILMSINSVPKNFYNDVSVVLCHWGGDSREKSSVIKTLDCILAQKGILTDIVFAEMVFEGEESVLKDYRKGEMSHIIMDGCEANRELFHKETLFNIATQNAKNEYLIFMDSDIYSLDEYWLWKIRHAISNYKTVVQGFSYVWDTKDSELNQLGYISNFLYDINSNMTYNPGMVYGMTKTYLSNIGGFNDRIITCDGDSIFFSEVFKDSYNFKTITPLAPYKGIVRKNLEAATPSCIDVPIVHQHHGTRLSRSYQNQLILLNVINTWKNSIGFDELFMYWKDLHDPLKVALATIDDSMEMDEYINEIVGDMYE